MEAVAPAARLGRTAMAGIEVRILTEGELGPQAQVDLGSLRRKPVPGGTAITGTCRDTAELWGMLGRLRRAGIRLRSLQRLACPLTEPSDAHLEVKIEVEGYAADAVGGLSAEIEVFESPPSTTLIMQVPGEAGLVEVLEHLESLALDLREIRVDAC